MGIQIENNDLFDLLGASAKGGKAKIAKLNKEEKYNLERWTDKLFPNTSSRTMAKTLDFLNKKNVSLENKEINLENYYLNLPGGGTKSTNSFMRDYNRMSDSEKERVKAEKEWLTGAFEIYSWEAEAAGEVPDFQGEPNKLEFVAFARAVQRVQRGVA